MGGKYARLVMVGAGGILPRNIFLRQLTGPLAYFRKADAVKPPETLSPPPKDSGGSEPPACGLRREGISACVGIAITVRCFTLDLQGV